MKKGIFLILLIAFAWSCNLNSNQPKYFDIGEVNGNVYTNKFFNLEMAFPEEWYLKNKEEIFEVTGDTVTFIGASNEMKTSNVHTATLFYATHYATDSAEIPSNRSLMLMVENLGLTPALKSAKDYLQAMNKELQTLGRNYDCSLTGPQTISGQEFYVLHCSGESGSGVTVYQKYYAMVKHRYALTFVLTSLSQEGFAELIGVVEGVDFKESPVK